MKNLKLASLLAVSLFSIFLVGCNNETKNNNQTNNGDFIIEDITPDEAVINYNDKLVDLALLCIKEIDTSGNISESINSIIENCKTSINEINNLWDWEWDSSLKDGAITVIEKYIEYYTKFSELIPFLEKEDDLSEEEKATYDSILSGIETIDAELDEANSNLTLIQEQFAENHNFPLENIDEEAE